MADTDRMLYGNAPAPPAPTAPAPPAGAMNKGVTGADPQSDPAQSLMAEATRLGGPLGGIAIGAATGASHHITGQEPQADPVSSTLKDPKFLSLAPEDKMSVLAHIDPKFAAMAPLDQQSVVTSLPYIQGRGAANLSSPEDIGTGPEGTIGTDQLMSPESQADASKKGGMLAATMVGAAAAPVAAALVPEAIAGSTLLGTAASGAAGGGAAGLTGTVTDQLAEGENPFRAQMLKETAKNTATGAAIGAVAAPATKAAGSVIDSIRKAMDDDPALEGEILEGRFTKAPEVPKAQHGVPVNVESPLDRATINTLPGGKDLSEDAFNTLQGHIGNRIPIGSSPKNMLMRAVEPVDGDIRETGLLMNALVNKAPEFSESIAEGEIGTTLREAQQEMRESLPRGLGDKRAEIIDNEVGKINTALVSRDPQEILAARRELGGKIDWDNILKNPDTDSEVQNTIRSKIYQALTDKMHELPGMNKLDEVFQPNLELQSYLKSKLGEDIMRDPVAASAMHESELSKGRKQLAVASHNARVDKNWSRLKTIGLAGSVAAGALGSAEAIHRFAP